MSEQEKREDPQFETNSVDDLEELLARAANFADCYCSDTIASEFRDAREFVANDLRDELEDDPLLVTDGGQSETGVHRHTQQIRDRFPEPLSYLLVELAEMNRDKWLEGERWRRDTIGAEDVMEYGLTENQRTWANQIAEQMGVSHEAYR